MMKQLKPLKHDDVKLLVVHCVANPCNRPFSTENLIACGEAKYGQCSYHYYVRYDGSVIPLLPETVQGVHARYYNHCSLGIVYEGGLNAQGEPADTRTEAQKHALYELLKDLTRDYPQARILGHCELPKQLPRVAKRCPCYLPSQEYSQLNGNQK